MFGFESPRGSLLIMGGSSCNSLLRELEQLWEDIGENEREKHNMLLELERECLEVCRRKVNEVANAKSQLHHSVAAKEAEFATLNAFLGELSVKPPIPSGKKPSSLKDQLAHITLLVEDLKLKKEDRMKQFADVKSQVEKITGELSGYGHLTSSISSMNLEDEDFSARKLSAYQSYLHKLQKDKSERLERILEYVNEVHSLCGVLGLDFSKTVSEIHPSLDGSSPEKTTNISDIAIEGLKQTIVRLKTEKKVRLQKLKDAAESLFDLWNLMDTDKEERRNFSGINSTLASTEPEIVDQGALCLEIIQQVSAEVERLTKLKANRMKELVLKRRQELEDICRKAHIQPDPTTAADKANAMIDSGLVDPCELLLSIETLISKAQAEVSSRGDIMDRIQRWLCACDEENWLECYNLDGSRYAAGRGGHVNLKRAERARILVNKIPAMVDNLISKTLAWEDENRNLFLYDGVRLVSILEDFKISRQQKEEDKKRARDQKKLQDMLLTEKEALFGSKPSPRRSTSFRKVNGYYAHGNGSVTPSPRRNSVGCATPELLTPRSYSGRQNGYFKEMRKLPSTLNFPAKEDTISFSSVCGSEPESPPQCQN